MASLLSIPVPHAVLSFLELEETPQMALASALDSFESKCLPYPSLPVLPPFAPKEHRKVPLSPTLQAKLRKIAASAPLAHSDPISLARRLLAWYAVPPSSPLFGGKR